MTRRKNLIAALILVTGLTLNHTWLVRGQAGSSLISQVKSQPLTTWNALALLAVGETIQDVRNLCQPNTAEAISYAGSVLALTAAGVDARSCQSDLVALLEQTITQGQIGSSALLNDDIFGVLALVASGEPVAGQSVQAGVSTLLAGQQVNGSLGVFPLSGNDADMTAAAVWAFDVTGQVAAAQKARQYLQSIQNADGGFPAYGQIKSNAYTTAWVMMAGVGGESARQYLESFGTSSEAAAYRLLAQSGKTLPLRILARATSVQNLSEVLFKLISKNLSTCSGSVSASTALEVAQQAASKCGYTIDVVTTSYGPYVRQIGHDRAESVYGWMFTVNDVVAATSADQALVKPSDRVLWFYGQLNQTPPAFGQTTGLTPDTEARVGLGLTVEAPISVAGATQSEVRLEVKPGQLQFGRLQPGARSEQTLEISNQGNVSLDIGASVRGQALFINNTTIDNRYWAEYSQELRPGVSDQAIIGLTVPLTASAGSYTGELAIWGRRK